MSTKKVAKRAEQILYILIVLGILVVVNVLTTKKFFRWDLTENKIYSISNATKNILNNLDDIVNIKVYFSKELPPNMKTIESNVRDLLAEYDAFSNNNLRISWEDPGKNEETKRKARALGIPEVRMQILEKERVEVRNGYLGIAVLYSDKKEVLPVVQDLQNFEYDLTQAIMKVVRTEIPEVAVLKTDTTPYIPPSVRQQMRIDSDDATKEKYKPIFEKLQENYMVDLVDVSEGKKIDSKYRTLIVPGGTTFTERDLFEIDQFFMNGGNLIVLADAVEVGFQYGPSGKPVMHGMLDLLGHYGARVENNMILDASCGQVQVPQNFGGFNMNVLVNYPYFVRVVEGGFNPQNPAVAGLGEMVFPWTSSITLLASTEDSVSHGLWDEVTLLSQDVKGVPLVKSSEKSWLQAGTFNLNPQQQWNPGGQTLKQSNIIVYLNGNFTSYFKDKQVPQVKSADDTLSQIKLSPEDSDRTIVAGNSNGHLIITADSDFLSAQNAAPANQTWLLNVVDWLTLDETLIGVRSRTMADRSISKDKLAEDSALPNIIRIVNIGIMPSILILVGLFIFLRRKNLSTAPAPATTNNKEEKK